MTEPEAYSNGVGSKEALIDASTQPPSIHRASAGLDTASEDGTSVNPWVRVLIVWPLLDDYLWQHDPSETSATVTVHTTDAPMVGAGDDDASSSPRALNPPLSIADQEERVATVEKQVQSIMTRRLSDILARQQQQQQALKVHQQQLLTPPSSAADPHAGDTSLDTRSNRAGGGGRGLSISERIPASLQESDGGDDMPPSPSTSIQLERVPSSPLVIHVTPQPDTIASPSATGPGVPSADEVPPILPRVPSDESSSPRSAPQQGRSPMHASSAAAHKQRAASSISSTRRFSASVSVTTARSILLTTIKEVNALPDPTEPSQGSSSPDAALLPAPSSVPSLQEILDSPRESPPKLFGSRAISETTTFRDIEDLHVAWRLQRLSNFWFFRAINRHPLFFLLIAGFVVVQFVLTEVLRFGHPGYVASTLFGCVIIFIASCVNVEKTTLRLLVGSFQWWYIVTHAAALLIIGGFSLGNDSPNDDSATNHALWIVTHTAAGAIMSLFFLNLDALAPATHTIIRIIWLVAALVIFGHFFVTDLIGNPLFKALEVCIVYCTTTRRLAYVAVGQVFLFLLKYLFQTVRTAFTGRSQFVILTFPVKFSVSQSTLDAVSGFHHMILHLSTNIPRSLLQRADVTKSPNSFVNRSFPFRPIVTSVWLRKISHHRFYKFYLAFVIGWIASITAYRQLSSSPSIGLLLVIIPLTLSILALELTRFDRTLTKCVLHKFEWWVLALSGASYIIFGFWANVVKSSETENVLTSICAYTAWSCLFYGLSFVDAAPTLDRKIRIMFLAALVINSWRVYFFEYYANSYAQVEICIGYCSDLRSLAFSGLLTVTVLFTRYLFLEVFLPGKCLILRSQVGFAVKSVRESDLPTFSIRALYGSSQEASSAQLVRLSSSSSSPHIDDSTRPTNTNTATAVEPTMAKLAGFSAP